MSGARRQEGAGGGLRVDGRQGGGRLNNTQLIAPFSLFPSSWGRVEKKRKERKKYCHKQPQSSQSCALCGWVTAPNGVWTAVFSFFLTRNVIIKNDK